ncbi:hypothetical protein [Roseovarius sp. MMSF_3281]|uniref:hypothetical protein n=1 Tax=Roseovarius sp. MMSF_3281 TaxID=3046694 RepID=UPI00273E0108|nr:hypothetical protein [Roseovarius sp. MMSF_3281]
MNWLASLVVPKWAKWAAAGLIALIIVIAVVRQDAKNDVRTELADDAKAARLGHRENAEDAKDEVDTMAGDGLLRELTCRLSGACPDK